MTLLQLDKLLLETATFAVANGATVATVTDTSHGANVGDFVTFSDAASLGGNVTAAVLNQEYEIHSVPLQSILIQLTSLLRATAVTQAMAAEAPLLHIK